MKTKYKGIWLFGLSGVGKTYLSKKISKLYSSSFIIDGDIVRLHVSFDLGYSIKDRIKQNRIVLGIAKIAMLNKQFPIISSVYLNPKVYELGKKNKIRFIKVVTSKKKRINKKLGAKNVIGKDLVQPHINCETFENNSFNIKKLKTKFFDKNG